MMATQACSRVVVGAVSPTQAFAPAESLKASANFGLLRPAVRSSKMKMSKERSLRISAQVETTEATISGVLFEPFREAQGDMVKVPQTNTQSLARQRYASACEAAVNEQINVEYNVSYIYHALYCYFDRDNVALPGFAKYFKAASDEEREHAERLMKYQNVRGGKVKLSTLVMPPTEFDHPEKGDALYAMELVLSLEKLNYEKLVGLHKVASQNEDPHLSDFVEGALLEEQVEAVKKVAEMVAQLRRIGKGHGVWHYDQTLGAAA